jgi:hypothetical protein
MPGAAWLARPSLIGVHPRRAPSQRVDAIRVEFGLARRLDRG